MARSVPIERESSRVIIQCTSCQARYHYDESRFGGASVKKIKCTKCTTVFEIRNPAVPRASRAGPSSVRSAAGPSPDEFSLDETALTEAQQAEDPPAGIPGRARARRPMPVTSLAAEGTGPIGNARRPRGTTTDRVPVPGAIRNPRAAAPAADRPAPLARVHLRAGLGPDLRDRQAARRHRARERRHRRRGHPVLAPARRHRGAWTSTSSSWT